MQMEQEREKKYIKAKMLNIKATVFRFASSNHPSYFFS